MFNEFKSSTYTESQLVEEIFNGLFTIDENKVLHPTKEFYNCEGYVFQPYIIFESNVIRNYIQRNYPEDKRDELLECVGNTIFSFSIISNKIRIKFDKEHIKNPYSDNLNGLVIAMDPKDVNEYPTVSPEYYPKNLYKPNINQEHVYLVKSKEGNESFAPSFPYVSYADGFMSMLNRFYKELGYDKEFSISHLNLYNINRPKVLCIGLCYLVPNSLFEYSTPLNIPNAFDTYHYLKTDELEIVTVNKTPKQVHDVLEYRVNGESDFKVIADKIKREVGFDFENSEMHDAHSEFRIFFINHLKNHFEIEVGRRCIELVVDNFMNDYYFDKLAKEHSQFVAVDIWDLSEKLVEFVVNQDHYRESMPGITIGNAYNCIYRYIQDSIHLEVVSKFLKESKQLVMCSHMGGKYLPVELQCLETGNLYTDLVFTPNIEEYEKHKDLYTKQAIILDNVYLKDTFMKLIDENGKVNYVPVMVGYVGDDTDTVFNFSEKYTEAMNEQMVYLHSDGTVGKAFTNGIPTGRVYSVPLEELNENHKEVHYHLMGTSTNVSIGIYPSTVDFSLTKYYSHDELPSAV